jgi:hypothetical protein
MAGKEEISKEGVMLSIEYDSRAISQVGRSRKDEDEEAKDDDVCKGIQAPRDEPGKLGQVTEGSENSCKEHNGPNLERNERR